MERVAETRRNPCASPRHPLAVDWGLAVFNVAMAVAWLRLAAVHPAARLLVVAHLFAATLPWLLGWAPPPRSRALRLTYDAYPLVWVAAFWSELDLHGRLVGTLRDDHALAALDRALFGVHLNQTWLAAMHATAFSEPMHFIYFSYYLMLLGIPLALILGGSQQQLQEGVLRFTLAYLTCFLVYAWWPTIGPAVPAADFPLSVSRGWFFRLNHWIRGTGDSLGTAFPSSHVAGALSLAWITWRVWGGRVAAGVTFLAVGIMGATVYTQSHFAADSLAGALVALSLQALAIPAFVSADSRAAAHPALSLAVAEEPAS